MQIETMYGIIGFMASVIVLLIGALWASQSGATKKIFEKLDALWTALGNLEKGLRGDLTELDRRVTRLEARRCNGRGDD